jgi:hypothetical protein
MLQIAAMAESTESVALGELKKSATSEPLSTHPFQ